MNFEKEKIKILIFHFWMKKLFLILTTLSLWEINNVVANVVITLDTQIWHRSTFLDVEYPSYTWMHNGAFSSVS